MQISGQRHRSVRFQQFLELGARGRANIRHVARALREIQTDPTGGAASAPSGAGRNSRRTV